MNEEILTLDNLVVQRSTRVLEQKENKEKFEQKQLKKKLNLLK